MKKSKYFISIDMSKNTNIIYIYIYIYATCWVYIQAHSFENQYNMEEKFLPKSVIQACFTTISLPMLEKKSIKLKTSWHQYTSSLILKTHTHTPTPLLLQDCTNKEKSN